MLSQEKLLNFIFVSINDIQVSKEKRVEIAQDPSRSHILELREDLIVIIDKMKAIYWHRESSIKDGFLPIIDDGEDERLRDEANAIFKQMCALNCDIAKMMQAGVV